MEKSGVGMSAFFIYLSLVDIVLSYKWFIINAALQYNLASSLLHSACSLFYVPLPNIYVVFFRNYLIDKVFWVDMWFLCKEREANKISLSAFKLFSGCPDVSIGYCVPVQGKGVFIF